jgi:predicted metal-dependent enzyme (double-stranded beta helix superfamily)
MEVKLQVPERDLSAAELRQVVQSLASSPELWREHVGFSDQERHFVSLSRDQHLDVWLICWTPANDTGWHDHDISSGAVAVVEGQLEESSPRIAGEPASRLVSAGESFDFGPDHIHRLVGVAPQSVSIHAYSPPLWRLGQYCIDERGVMRRLSVSYAEELRPLEAAAAA